ncbi:hypothetical protein JX266_014395, partial [Neoarthrinium moseri]
MIAQHAHYVLLAVMAAILLLLALASHHGHAKNIIQGTWAVKHPLVSTPGSGSESSSLKGIPSGPTEPSDGSSNCALTLETGKKCVMDKAVGHKYRFIYEKYMPVSHNRKVKLLEVGLDCDMSYGLEASYRTWLEYFPHIELYYI